MIGRLEKTVLDCPDPRTLASFYASILGMRINEDTEDWVVIGSEPGARQLAFQRVENWSPPVWGDPHRRCLSARSACSGHVGYRNCLNAPGLRHTDSATVREPPHSKIHAYAQPPANTGRRADRGVSEFCRLALTARRLGLEGAV